MTFLQILHHNLDDLLRTYPVQTGVGGAAGKKPMRIMAGPAFDCFVAISNMAVTSRGILFDTGRSEDPQGWNIQSECDLMKSAVVRYKVVAALDHRSSFADGIPVTENQKCLATYPFESGRQICLFWSDNKQDLDFQAGEHLGNLDKTINPPSLPLLPGP